MDQKAMEYAVGNVALDKMQKYKYYKIYNNFSHIQISINMLSNIKLSELENKKRIKTQEIQNKR